MMKAKTTMLLALYVILVIVSLPFILVWSIANLVIYGVVKIESLAICEIDDEELTGAWNKMVSAFTDMVDSIKDCLQTELEL